MSLVAGVFFFPTSVSSFSTSGIAKLKTNYIIFVETVSLQGINNCGRLLDTFEVRKAEKHFLTFFRLARDKTQLLVAWEWPEQVSNFPLSRIGR